MGIWALDGWIAAGKYKYALQWISGFYFMEGVEIHH